MRESGLSVTESEDGCPQASALAARRIADGCRVVQRDGNPNRSHAITFLQLGKLEPIGARHLDELRGAFAALLPENVGRRVAILGLAESGIVPAYAMHSLCKRGNWDCHWYCTTRSPRAAGSRQGTQVRFREEHSHAPDHWLPQAFLEKLPEELWIVEDEVTTGRTILNLLRQLPPGFRQIHVRIFCLVDLREPADDKAFTGELEQLGWSHQVVYRSVLRSSIRQLLERAELGAGYRRSSHAAEGPSRLVQGEHVRHHLAWLDASQGAALQHVTLSPWEVDGKVILRRQALGNGYYLYNAKS